MNLISGILLVLFLLVSMVLLKCTNFPLVFHFLNFFPIVSSIGIFNYNPAHFLCNLFSPLVPNDYFYKDTFSFASQVKNANLTRRIFVSYNVTSLFTNIPLKETIDIAINLIFATSQTHFIFNRKLYNQLDGVAIGSLLAPVIANIFIGFYKSKWLNEYNLNKPKFF